MEYQRDFSELHPGTMFDEQGRLQKARKTEAGCSTGILTHHYAGLFGEVVGVDIDEGAVVWARSNRTAPNLEYRVGDSLELPFPDAGFDFAT
ncbi:MAG: class I SAM-dependent methyltransferase, partial [Thermoanaerobaculales bacterium]|nr:class I SAM-dependent methyltransferase [Thermoanaerobaculales bacterium]